MKHLTIFLFFICFISCATEAPQQRSSAAEVEDPEEVIKIQSMDSVSTEEIKQDSIQPETNPNTQIEFRPHAEILNINGNHIIQIESLEFFGGNETVSAQWNAQIKKATQKIKLLAQQKKSELLLVSNSSTPYVFNKIEIENIQNGMLINFITVFNNVESVTLYY